MELSPELLAELYTAAPEDFLSVRQRLAADARKAGDTELAKAVTAQRKPTLAAWIVNAHVHANPSVVEQLLDLGARLRAAHSDLDAGALRELSVERRALVADVSTAALADAGRPAPGATLRDDVTNTVDAAVADPQVAARLGRLSRGETWSGFGVAMDAPSDAPMLTVIRGGRDASAAARPPSKASAPAKTSAPDPTTKPDPAAARRARRARDRAAETFAAADQDLQQQQDAERSAASRIQELTAQLGQLEKDLAAAKREHDRLRQDVRSARNRRREARSALDRAERQVT